MGPDEDAGNYLEPANPRAVAAHVTAISAGSGRAPAGFPGISEPALPGLSDSACGRCCTPSPGVRPGDPDPPRGLHNYVLFFEPSSEKSPTPGNTTGAAVLPASTFSVTHSFLTSGKSFPSALGSVVSAVASSSGAGSCT